MELIKSFLANSDSNAQDEHSARKPSLGTLKGNSARERARKMSDSSGTGARPTSATPTSAVPIPSTPASLLPHLKPTQAERDDGGPYKAAMVLRMEALARGGRIQPPCDRCRRLHMDCLKNLTACQGCTKKHAKCSWKDVREEELRGLRGSRQSASTSPDPTLPATEDMESPSNVDNLSSRQSPVLPPPFQSVNQEKPARKELDLLPPAASHASPGLPAASPIGFETINQRPSLGSLPTAQALLGHTSPATSSASPLKSSDPSSTKDTELSEPGALTGHRSARSPLYNPQSPPGASALARSAFHPEPEEEEDEGDRLQALAAQVYRSASAQQAAQ